MKPFQPVKGCDDFKMKHENESGDSSDNGESSDSSAMNISREKLMADVRCPLCPIKRINVFHQPSDKNVFLWNTSNWNRHLKLTHKLVDKTADIDKNSEKKYQHLIATKDETSPVFESKSNQKIKDKLKKTIKNEIKENNLTAHRAKKSKEFRPESKIDNAPEKLLVNYSDSSDSCGEITYGNGLRGKLLLD